MQLSEAIAWDDLLEDTSGYAISTVRPPVRAFRSGVKGVFDNVRTNVRSEMSEKGSQLKELERGFRLANKTKIVKNIAKGTAILGTAVLFPPSIPGLVTGLLIQGAIEVYDAVKLEHALAKYEVAEPSLPNWEKVSILAQLLNTTVLRDLIRKIDVVEHNRLRLAENLSGLGRSTYENQSWTGNPAGRDCCSTVLLTWRMMRFHRTLKIGLEGSESMRHLHEFHLAATEFLFAVGARLGRLAEDLLGSLTQGIVPGSALSTISIGKIPIANHGIFRWADWCEGWDKNRKDRLAALIHDVTAHMGMTDLLKHLEQTWLVGAAVKRVTGVIKTSASGAFRGALSGFLAQVCLKGWQLTNIVKAVESGFLTGSGAGTGMVISGKLKTSALGGGIRGDAALLVELIFGVVEGLQDKRALKALENGDQLDLTKRVELLDQILTAKRIESLVNAGGIIGDLNALDTAIKKLKGSANREATVQSMGDTRIVLQNLHKTLNRWLACQAVFRYSALLLEDVSMYLAIANRAHAYHAKQYAEAVYGQALGNHAACQGTCYRLTNGGPTFPLGAL